MHSSFRRALPPAPRPTYNVVVAEASTGYGVRPVGRTMKPVMLPPKVPQLKVSLTKPGSFLSDSSESEESGSEDEESRTYSPKPMKRFGTVYEDETHGDKKTRVEQIKKDTEVLSEERLQAIRSHYSKISTASERLGKILLDDNVVSTLEAGDSVDREEEEEMELNRQDYIDRLAARKAADELVESMQVDRLRNELWLLHDWFSKQQDSVKFDDSKFDSIEQGADEINKLFNDSKYTVEQTLEDLDSEKTGIFEVWNKLSASLHTVADRQQNVVDDMKKNITKLQDEVYTTRALEAQDAETGKRISEMQKMIDELRKQLARKEEDISTIRKQANKRMSQLEEELEKRSAQGVRRRTDVNAKAEDEYLEAELEQYKSRVNELKGHLERVEDSNFNLSASLHKLAREKMSHEDTAMLLSEELERREAEIWKQVENMKSSREREKRETQEQINQLVTKKVKEKLDEIQEDYDRKLEEKMFDEDQLREQNILLQKRLEQLEESSSSVPSAKPGTPLNKRQFSLRNVIKLVAEKGREEKRMTEESKRIIETAMAKKSLKRSEKAASSANIASPKSKRRAKQTAKKRPESGSGRPDSADTTATSGTTGTDEIEEEEEETLEQKVALSAAAAAAVLTPSRPEQIDEEEDQAEEETVEEKEVPEVSEDTEPAQPLTPGEEIEVINEEMDTIQQTGRKRLEESRTQLLTAGVKLERAIAKLDAVRSHREQIADTIPKPSDEQLAEIDETIKGLEQEVQLCEENFTYLNSQKDRELKEEQRQLRALEREREILECEISVKAEKDMNLLLTQQHELLVKLKQAEARAAEAEVAALLKVQKEAHSERRPSEEIFQAVTVSTNLGAFGQAPRESPDDKEPVVDEKVVYPESTQIETKRTDEPTVVSDLRAAVQAAEAAVAKHQAEMDNYVKMAGDLLSDDDVRLHRMKRRMSELEEQRDSALAALKEAEGWMQKRNEVRHAEELERDPAFVAAKNAKEEAVKLKEETEKKMQEKLMQQEELLQRVLSERELKWKSEQDLLKQQLKDKEKAEKELAAAKQRLANDASVKEAKIKSANHLANIQDRKVQEMDSRIKELEDQRELFKKMMKVEGQHANKDLEKQRQDLEKERNHLFAERERAMTAASEAKTQNLQWKLEQLHSESNAQRMALESELKNAQQAAEQKEKALDALMEKQREREASLEADRALRLREALTEIGELKSERNAAELQRKALQVEKEHLHEQANLMERKFEVEQAKIRKEAEKALESEKAKLSESLDTAAIEQKKILESELAAANVMMHEHQEQLRKFLGGKDSGSKVQLEALRDQLKQTEQRRQALIDAHQEGVDVLKREAELLTQEMSQINAEEARSHELQLMAKKMQEEAKLELDGELGKAQEKIAKLEEDAKVAQDNYESQQAVLHAYQLGRTLSRQSDTPEESSKQKEELETKLKNMESQLQTLQSDKAELEKKAAEADVMLEAKLKEALLEAENKVRADIEGSGQRMEADVQDAEVALIQMREQLKEVEKTRPSSPDKDAELKEMFEKIQKLEAQKTDAEFLLEKAAQEQADRIRQAQQDAIVRVREIELRRQRELVSKLESAQSAYSTQQNAMEAFKRGQQQEEEQHIQYVKEMEERLKKLADEKEETAKRAQKVAEDAEFVRSKLEKESEEKRNNLLKQLEESEERVVSQRKALEERDTLHQTEREAARAALSDAQNAVKGLTSKMEEMMKNHVEATEAGATERVQELENELIAIRKALVAKEEDVRKAARDQYVGEVMSQVKAPEITVESTEEPEPPKEVSEPTEALREALEAERARKAKLASELARLEEEAAYAESQLLKEQEEQTIILEQQVEEKQNFLHAVLAAEEQLQARKKQRIVVTRIQALWRGYMHRALLKKHLELRRAEMQADQRAEVVQVNARELARRFSTIRVQLDDRRKQIQAASIIQAVSRGYLVRSQRSQLEELERLQSEENKDGQSTTKYEPVPRPKPVEGKKDSDSVPAPLVRRNTITIVQPQLDLIPQQAPSSTKKVKPIIDDTTDTDVKPVQKPMKRPPARGLSVDDISLLKRAGVPTLWLQGSRINGKRFPPAPYGETVVEEDEGPWRAPYAFVLSRGKRAAKRRPQFLAEKDLDSQAPEEKPADRVLPPPGGGGIGLWKIGQKQQQQQSGKLGSNSLLATLESNNSIASPNSKPRARHLSSAQLTAKHQARLEGLFSEMEDVRRHIMVSIWRYRSLSHEWQRRKSGKAKSPRASQPTSPSAVQKHTTTPPSGDLMIVPIASSKSPRTKRRRRRTTRGMWSIMARSSSISGSDLSEPEDAGEAVEQAKRHVLELTQELKRQEQEILAVKAAYAREHEEHAIMRRSLLAGAGSATGAFSVTPSVTERRSRRKPATVSAEMENELSYYRDRTVQEKIDTRLGDVPPLPLVSSPGYGGLPVVSGGIPEKRGSSAALQMGKKRDSEAVRERRVMAEYGITPRRKERRATDYVINRDKSRRRQDTRSRSPPSITAKPAGSYPALRLPSVSRRPSGASAAERAWGSGRRDTTKESYKDYSLRKSLSTEEPKSPGIFFPPEPPINLAALNRRKVQHRSSGVFGNLERRRLKLETISRRSTDVSHNM